MNRICLEDFDAPDRCLLFDLDDSLRPLSRELCSGHNLRPQGFFSERKLGLWRRIKTPVAVFSIGEALRMSILFKVFDISDPSVVAERKKLFVGVREFLLLKGGLPLFTVRYWNTSWASDTGDIFEYCERVTRSPESKREFLLIWNQVASGQEITADFLRKLA